MRFAPSFTGALHGKLLRSRAEGGDDGGGAVA
jgi:hypothetical protein